MEDVFNQDIKVEYDKKIYLTKQVLGHRQNLEKQEQRIKNKKELEEYLRTKEIEIDYNPYY